MTWGSLGNGDGQFNRPWGIAAGDEESVYVTDKENSRVQKFSSSGEFLGTWGSRGSGDGQFINPGLVAVDRSGNVYVADTGNHRVQVFDPGGRFLWKFGSEGSAEGELLFPVGLTVDGLGNVYVVEAGISLVSEISVNRVQVFDSQGQFIGAWGSEGVAYGEFLAPTQGYQSTRPGEFTSWTPSITGFKCFK
jgi:DNA-binding beta-propeller fold protein YncE